MILVIYLTSLKKCMTPKIKNTKYSIKYSKL